MPPGHVQARWDPFRPAGLRWLVWGMAAGWTLLVGLSLQQSWFLLQDGVLKIAMEEASDHLEGDLAYRSWATRHGGVYAPVTPATPPNPHLAGVPERDLTTPSGRQLTLLNPEYMERQVFEATSTPLGRHDHMTSLKPLRPQNAADPWEAKALRALETGQKEVGSVEQIEGRSYYRLMRPLVTEEGCLKCHGGQGYRVGDIRGGICTSTPLAPHRAVARAQFVPIAGGHGVVWALGLAALAVGYRQTQRRLAERRQAEEVLRQSEHRFRTLTEQAPLGISLLRADHTFEYCNGRFTELFGYRVEDLPTQQRWFELAYPDPRYRQEATRLGPEELGTVGSAMAERLVCVRCKDGSEKLVEVRATVLNSGHHLLTYSDVTERQRVEREREKLIVELRAALAQVKTLSGLIPICSGCKKIRDDRGFWNQVESYISKHTEAQFTHGMCPDCIKKFYPELEKEILEGH